MYFLVMADDFWTFFMVLQARGITRSICIKLGVITSINQLVLGFT